MPLISVLLFRQWPWRWWTTSTSWSLTSGTPSSPVMTRGCVSWSSTVRTTTTTTTARGQGAETRDIWRGDALVKNKQKTKKLVLCTDKQKSPNQLVLYSDKQKHLESWIVGFHYSKSNKQKDPKQTNPPWTVLNSDEKPQWFVLYFDNSNNNSENSWFFTLTKKQKTTHTCGWFGYQYTHERKKGSGKNVVWQQQQKHLVRCSEMNKQMAGSLFL